MQINIFDTCFKILVNKKVLYCEGKHELIENRKLFQSQIEENLDSFT